jgi:hypothetical protein
LGQIEDASFFGLAGARLTEIPAGVTTTVGVVMEPDALPDEFAVRVMFGVVTHTLVPRK